MRVVLGRHWLRGMRGGERCLEVFCELFPETENYAPCTRIPRAISSAGDAYLGDNQGRV